MSQTKDIEIKYFASSFFFSVKSCHLKYTVGKRGRDGESTDDNTVCALCMLDGCSRMKTKTHNI